MEQKGARVKGWSGGRRGTGFGANGALRGERGPKLLNCLKPKNGSFWLGGSLDRVGESRKGTRVWGWSGGGVEAQGGGFCHKSFAVGIRIKRRVFGEGWRAGAGVGKRGYRHRLRLAG